METKLKKLEIKSRFFGEVLFSYEGEQEKNISDVLQDAVKKEANLRGADLSGADLSGADLSGADLSGADLSGADLSWADLSWADLSGADLSGADLSGADLSWADLSWADLSGADLSGADLSGADLSGADLSGADLIYVVISGAKHVVIAHKDSMQVGCEIHEWDWWTKKNIKQLGESNNYTEDQIREYTKHIDYCKSVFVKSKPMKEKIIEILSSFIEEYIEIKKDDCPEIAAEIEAALIWHGPDEVPPRYSLFSESILVVNQSGENVFFDFIDQTWVNYQIPSRSAHVEKWRYPAPEKIK